MKLRLTTPAGDAAMLELAPPVLYSDLQAAIEKKLRIAPTNQRIRLGFPPKELRLQPDEEVPLKHGDKVRWLRRLLLLIFFRL